MVNKINSKETLINNGKQILVQGRNNNGKQMIAQNNMANRINEQKLTGTKHEQIKGQINIYSSVNSPKSSLFNGEINISDRTNQQKTTGTKHEQMMAQNDMTSRTNQQQLPLRNREKILIEKINQKQTLTNEEQVMVNKINSKETLINNGKQILVQGRNNNGKQMIAQNNMANRINEQKLTGTKHEQIKGQINIYSSVNSPKSSLFNGVINLPKLPVLNANQKLSQTVSKNQIKSDMSYLEKFKATYSKDPLFSELNTFKSLTPQIVFSQIETKSNADAIIKQDIDCNSKTIYTVSMPRSLSKTDSLKSFDLIRHSLREKASEGIDILLKFPRD